MTEADIAFGMYLKTQNGWNQTEADWRRFLTFDPDGCFVAELDGQAAGTVTTITFGTTAWIAMLLVERDLRGRGIGTALMKHAIAHLDACGITRIRLDATPLGEPIYRRLDFAAEFSLMRFEGRCPADLPAATTALLRESDVEEVIRLDEAVTRTDRRKLITQLATEFPHSFRLLRDAERIVGFVSSRPGSRAAQLGPCIVRGGGERLLDDAMAALAGEPIFVDIPADNAAAIAWAKSRGLTVQRPFVRMTRGPIVSENLTEMWASSGPTKG
jgi:GNAT superfamily N-acetyltransferase